MPRTFFLMIPRPPRATLRHTLFPHPALFRSLFEIVYGEHPRAFSPAGDRAGLDAVGPRDCSGFHRELYTPDRAVLAVVGDIDPDRTLERVRGRVSDWAPAGVRTVAPRPPLLSPPRCSPGSIKITDLPIREACTAAATPALVPP